MKELGGGRGDRRQRFSQGEAKTIVKTVEF